MFLEGLVARTKWTKEIHVVLDNLSAHKTQDVERFLASHPQVHFHFTPTYSSWLNQVELWFAKIQRDVIRRGCSPRSPTSATNCASTSERIRNQLRPSAGPTQIPPAASVLTKSPGQLTSTSVFNLCHSASFHYDQIAHFWVVLLGFNGSFVMRTQPERLRHQARKRNGAGYPTPQ